MGSVVLTASGSLGALSSSWLPRPTPCPSTLSIWKACLRLLQLQQGAAARSPTDQRLHRSGRRRSRSSQLTPVQQHRGQMSGAAAAAASGAQQQGGYSLGAVLTAAGLGVLAGVSICDLLWRRAARQARPRSGGRLSPLNLSHFAGRTVSSEAGYGSGLSTPAETPRTGSAENLAGLAADARMAVIVRQDVPMAANKIVQHATWTVLGMFKKLYKRRDPNLKVWDVTGERLEVLLAPSEDELMAVQASARALGLPTHTFAGRDRQRKQRTVMAVGPADAETLRQVTGHLAVL